MFFEENSNIRRNMWFYERIMFMLVEWGSYYEVSCFNAYVKTYFSGWRLEADPIIVVPNEYRRASFLFK